MDSVYQEFLEHQRASKNNEDRHREELEALQAQYSTKDAAIAALKASVLRLEKQNHKLYNRSMETSMLKQVLERENNMIRKRLATIENIDDIFPDRERLLRDVEGE